MTRAELLKIVMLITGNNSSKNGSLKFEDVDEDDWYYTFVKDATDLDIIKGYNEDGEYYYKPDNDTTRAEAAKILLFALDEGLDKYTQWFIDVDSGDWHGKVMTTLYNLKISTGYIDKNGFRYIEPDRAITRKEMAIWAYNAIFKNAKDKRQ